MEVIRSRFSDHIDHAAAYAPQFCRVRVCIDLEFLHRVEAVLVVPGAEPERCAKEGIVIVRAVHQQRGHLALALETGSSPKAPRDPRGQHDEVKEAPTVHRQPRYRASVDGGAYLASSSLDL